MRLPIIVGLLVVSCRTSTSLGISNRALTPSHFNHPENGEFFHRINDWLRHAKDRIWSRIIGVDPDVPPSTLEEFDLEKYYLTHLRHQEKVPLDISAVVLDPDTDWGFRIGDWYIIQKGQTVSSRFDFGINPNQWIDQSTVPQGNEVSLGNAQTFGPDYTMNAESTQMPSSVSPVSSPLPQSNTMPQTVTPTSTQLNLPEFAVTEISSTERVTSVTESAEPNETDNELTNPGSVEVFM